MVLQRIVKPQTQKGKRALEKRVPKLIENDKNAILMRGGKTSEIVNQALKDIYALKKPNGTMLQRKNLIRPFEDQNPIEMFGKKYDASLFLLGSHSKKRPHNLVMGRLYDGGVLDMIELGIENFKALKDFKTSKCTAGCKPCLLFSGDFDSDNEHRRLKNLFIDFFRGPVVQNIRLQGIEYVIQFTSVEGKIHLRSYKILMKKSGSRVPRVELEEMGPSLDLVMRRTKVASDDLYKLARRQPKAAKIGKKKNVSMDAFGTQQGRIHMQKQDLDKLQTRKMKGLKRGPGDKATAGGKRARTEEEEEEEEEGDEEDDDEWTDDDEEEEDQ